MPVKSKLTKRKAKISKKDLAAGRRPSVLTSGWPKDEVEKLSKEEKFLERMQDLVDSGIEIEEDDIPDDMLDVWEEFKDDVKPKLAKKNWLLWSAIFAPLILPGYVTGLSGKVELPPDAKKPSVQVPAPNPTQIKDYAKEYFREHGLELCKTLTETDLKALKDQMVSNWGKGEDFFKSSFQEDYIDSKARLDTIYRTEYEIAQNEGIMTRAKHAGHEFKVWNCALDERSCPVCSNLHGITVSMDEEFPSEEGGIMRPPRHPNCRCVLTSVRSEDLDQEGLQEDASYLNDVSNFMKLNYKCKFDGNDYKCDNQVPIDSTNEISMTNVFEMRQKVSDYININNIQKPYDDESIRLFEKWGSGPSSDWPENLIKEYEQDYSNLNKLNKINHDAILAFNYNQAAINNPKNKYDQMLSTQLKETLDNIVTKQPIVLWRGERKSDWDDILKSGSGKTDRFLALTQSKSIAEQFKTNNDLYLIRFELPIGSHAIPSWIETGVESPNELEWILNKDTKLEVTGKSGNVLNVKVTISKRDQEGMQEDASYLNDVSNHFIKLSANCKESEKVGGDRPCSGSQSSEPDNHSTIAMFDRNYRQPESGLEFYARLWEIDSEVNDILTEKVEGSSNYNLFNKYSDNWLRGVDPESRENAIQIVEHDKLLRSYLLHKQFGLDIPETTKIYRVGPIRNGMTNSFFPNRKVAESYQKRMGVETVHEYEVSTKDIIPSLSGSGEIWIPGQVENINEKRKSDQSYLEDVVKLNYNCPASEKQGEGTGSCSKNLDKSPSESISFDSLSQEDKELAGYYQTYGAAKINSYLRKGDSEVSSFIKSNQANTEDPTFPVAPFGMCLQGVETLGRWYSGHDVKYAYRQNPSPGHVWIFVDGDPIDSYYGRVARTREWMYPDKTFNTFAELNQYQHESTVTWRWTPSQNASYLDEVTNFIKLNYNCPSSEKNSSDRPCSDSFDKSEPERWKVSNFIVNLDVGFDVHLPEKTARLIYKQGTKFNDKMLYEKSHSPGVQGLTTHGIAGPEIWYNKITGVKNADDEGIYKEALHELGHSLEYPYKNKDGNLTKLDIWKDLSVKDIHTDLVKLGYSSDRYKGLSIDISDPSETWADLFQLYNNPRMHLKLREGLPKIHKKLTNVLGKSDYDIPIPEKEKQLFKKLSEKGWNLKQSDLTELGISDKQFEKISDLISPSYSNKPESFISNTENYNYTTRMKQIQDMFVEISPSEKLLKNTESVIRETTTNLWKSGITDGERKSITAYKMSNYQDFNSYLRTGRVFGNNTENEQWIKNNINNIDSLLEKSKLTKDITTYRYVSKGFAESKLIPNVGKSITEPGYMSTSYFEPVAKNAGNGQGAYMTIRVPSGTGIADLDSLATSEMMEYEVLLERGLTLHIKDHKVLNNGMDWFDVEVSKQKQDSHYLEDVATSLKTNQSQVTDPVFPVAPLGMCLQGVETLGNWYSGSHTVKYAYRENPKPGHVWIFVDGAPIDSYYGRVARTHDWMFPDKTFDTFEELNDYQHESTVTWRWTPNQNARYLDDVANFMKLNYRCEFNGTDWKCDDTINNFIKLNYNCPESEKNGKGKGSCSSKSISDKINKSTKKQSKSINFDIKNPNPVETKKESDRKSKTISKNISPTKSLSKIYANKSKTSLSKKRDISTENRYMKSDIEIPETVNPISPKEIIGVLKSMNVDLSDKSFWRNRRDRILEALAKQNGFNKNAQIVDKKVFNEKAKNGVILYRGVSGKIPLKHIAEGEYYSGTGITGNGIYATSSKSFAKRYAGESGNVFSMVLPNDSKIINVEKLHEIRRKYLEDIKKNHPYDFDLINKVVKDAGRFAVIMGYDAIQIETTTEVIILNRGKLIMQNDRDNTKYFQKLSSEMKINSVYLNDVSNLDSLQEDARYLDDVSDYFMKLNYNCPESEKSGTGPGSCSQDKPSLNLGNKMREKISKELPTLEENLTKLTAELSSIDKTDKIYKSKKSEITALKKRITGAKKFLAANPEPKSINIWESMNKVSGNKESKSPSIEAPTGSRFSNPNEITSSPVIHSTKNIDSITKTGFRFSNNSMYGRGIYFSNKETPSYGDPISVKLLPHKQLYIEKDTDVPKVIADLGLDYSDAELPNKMSNLGIGSIVFPVDNERYTLVFDPKKQNSDYLDGVVAFIKLNYRCKEGTIASGSFECGNETSISTSDKLSKRNNKNL